MSKQLSVIVPLLKYADVPPFAKTLGFDYQGLDGCVWQLFGQPQREQIPVAALSYGYDVGDSGTDWLIRADPVHLRLDRQAAYLLDAEFIGISAAESAALIDSINAYQDDFRIEAVHPARWYIRQSQAMDFQALRLEQIRGENVSRALPTGADRCYWQKISNEMQMLLYDHPVNLQRQQRGQAEINSLWFWGAGQLSVKADKAWQQVFSRQVLTQALAKQQGIALQAPPDNAALLLDKLGDGATLLQLDLLQDSQIPVWERDWLVPLQQALIDRRLESVHLYCETQVYHLQAQSWLSRVFSFYAG